MPNPWVNLQLTSLKSFNVYETLQVTARNGISMRETRPLVCAQHGWNCAESVNAHGFCRFCSSYEDNDGGRASITRGWSIQKLDETHYPHLGGVLITRTDGHLEWPGLWTKILTKKMVLCLRFMCGV